MKKRKRKGKVGGGVGFFKLSGQRLTPLLTYLFFPSSSQGEWRMMKEKGEQGLDCRKKSRNGACEVMSQVSLGDLAVS